MRLEMMRRRYSNTTITTAKLIADKDLHEPVLWAAACSDQGPFSREVGLMMTELQDETHSIKTASEGPELWYAVAIHDSNELFETFVVQVMKAFGDLKYA